ncbi:steroidogenic acute regulatory protein-like [Solenopsis invicta]|uniref:steroidogenic acute regulatory protein-like n=1 Tax=Solenopsis invicta TaxID=13686 RepID=UPI000595C1A2|nr:steroidogenic acute regulatory protein-like [Solenopsis invicta]XP_011165521.1 steroidogenic acute regulatory protein-like [Solenopsis invicta]XP_039307433.1 steroidogenic acute regulatory protein-like [Solenopsis invicta]
MAEDERQIRMAAEAILSGSINSQRSSVTQHSITRTPDIVLSEDLIAGARHNGRMSNVRRFFCLFVTFDLLLTFLMWLICTMIAGESLNTAFTDQVIHYHITTSLFDIVMAAICRFTVLLLFYALLYLNHWIIVAISTATTCAFLIAKVFLFDWTSANQPVFQVLLILTSFVLAWAEAWFFDFRVIPQETQARDWIRSFPDTERTPLLQNIVTESRQYAANVDHIGTFFTPVESPTHSDDEDIPRKQGDSKKLSKFSELFMFLAKLTPDKIDEYKTKTSKMLQDCHDLLTSEEWKDTTITNDGDEVSCMQLPSEWKLGGKVMKITGIIDAPASVLIDLLFDNIEEQASWNKHVSESIKLQIIDENTDIVYQATKPFGGGIITARDFVIFRHRNKCGNYYMSSGISIPTTVQVRPNMTRGENGISCFATEELPSEANKCRFTWILNTNLKGWIPQTVVDRSMSTGLVDFMTYLREYLNDLQKPSI